MIDTLTREVSLVSVPRDTRVRIKGLGWDKINHAFAAGGVALTQQTTENFLGIPVNYYAKADLESFGRVVDALGGVTIDVEAQMQYEDTWDHFVIDLKPGLQRLDGRTALQYVRYRDEEGDIGRVRRQQKFIKAVLAEMNTVAGVMKLPAIIREVSVSLDTNMPLSIMLGLAHQLKDALSTGLKVHVVEGSPYYINEISYWVPDVMNTSRKMAEMQGIYFSGSVQAAAQRMADEYQRNLPENAQLDDGNYYSKIVTRQVKPIPAPKLPTQTPPVRTTEAQTSTATAKPTTMPNTTTKELTPIVGQK
jgi:LCP family protein required for cell wall assembly